MEKTHMKSIHMNGNHGGNEGGRLGKIAILM